MNKIYALLDPLSNKVAYVGKTRVSLALRLSQHITLATTRNIQRKVCTWIRQLAAQSLRPCIQLLEECSDQAAASAEKRWYNFFQSKGEAEQNTHTPGAGTSYTRRIVNWSLYDHLLGLHTDEHIATLIGVTRKAVTYRRNVLGVKAKSRIGAGSGIPHKKPQKTQLIPSIIVLLGTMSDPALAKIAGTNKHVIKLARRRRAIPPWDPKRKGVFTPIKLSKSHKKVS